MIILTGQEDHEQYLTDISIDAICLMIAKQVARITAEDKENNKDFECHFMLKGLQLNDGRTLNGQIVYFVTFYEDEYEIIAQQTTLFGIANDDILDDLNHFRLSKSAVFQDVSLCYDAIESPSTPEQEE